ncbi:hypothetical protein GCM10012279_45270 [Micromonospora yangpuensis]|nr:hypothetical protein GCM10012279_45270 [Micromonospora yangpuensis]
MAAWGWGSFSEYLSAHPKTFFNIIMGGVVAWASVKALKESREANRGDPDGDRRPG